MDLADRERARARRYGTGAALLLVDVDRYARLCEARGAAAGDAVLAELMRQTLPTLRTADVLTRFSETQMAVFLAHADATGALDVAERIRERAEQLEVAWQPQAAVTASVGVAHLRAAHLNLQALVDDAEDAVAAARHANGNCVRAAPFFFFLGGGGGGTAGTSPPGTTNSSTASCWGARCSRSWSLLDKGESGMRGRAGQPLLHRGARAVEGRLEGDCVRCMCHGLKFDASGKCVQILGQDMICSKLGVRSDPVIERDAPGRGIWMGDSWPGRRTAGSSTSWI